MRALFGVLLILLPYVGLNNFAGPALPTWRLVNVALVVVWVSSFPIWVSPIMRRQATMLSSLVAAMGIQLVCAYKPIDFRDVGLLVGLLFLLSATLPVMSVYRGDPAFVMKLLRTSVYIAVVYQFYQIFAFEVLGRDAVTIFNDKTLVEKSNFFRINAGFLGAPSFMIESGHLGMFVGPVALFTQLAQHYRFERAPRFFLPLCAVSLLATTSSGALIYLALMLAIYLFIRLRSHAAAFAVLLTVWLAAGVIVIFFDDIVELLASGFPSAGTFLAAFTLALNKISNPGEVSRWAGAVKFIDAALQQPLFGYGLDGHLLYVDADPNILWPVVLMNHGIPVTGLLIAMMAFPIASAAVGSRYKLFIIPFAAVILHVSIAYGSYLWPAIWITQAICIGALCRDRNDVGLPHDARSLAI